MTDRQDQMDVEMRLRTAFAGGGLPPAPGRLAEVLERVPDAPVRGDSADGRARGSGRRTTFGLLGIAAVLAIGGALALSGGGRQTGPVPSTAPTGRIGTVVTYQVAWSATTPYSAAALAAEVEVVRRRIDATGAVGVTVRSDGRDGLVVGIPDGADPTVLRPLIGQTGRAAFVPLGDTALIKGDAVDPAKFPELLGGSDIADGRVAADQTGGRVVEIVLAPTAAARFGTWTAGHIGSYLAITVDGRVVSAPVINSEIPSGSVEISQAGTEGGWDLTEATAFASILKIGPLPAPLVETSSGLGPVDPSSVPSSVPATDSPDPAVPDPSGARFDLPTDVPIDLVCERVSDQSFTIHFDPNAARPIWASTDTLARLEVFWNAAGARGLVGPPPAIVDAAGNVIIRDGTVVSVRGTGSPTLPGFQVCMGPDAILISRSAAP